MAGKKANAQTVEMHRNFAVVIGSEQRFLAAQLPGNLWLELHGGILDTDCRVAAQIFCL